MAAYPDSRIISLNEQLIGLKKTYTPEPFGYCGNITPFSGNGSVIKKCEKIVDKITSHFKLLGSNGIDLVISKENIPYVIEVNPRFQGSLGCIERAYGVNVAKMHIEACTEKKPPAPMGNPSCFATRLILYAPKRLTAPDMISDPNISDTPFPNSIIEKGEPVCSINTEGRTRQEALLNAQKVSKAILR
jgi:predicted ATP-grasp superfamily ATP-dependent carboligase